MDLARFGPRRAARRLEALLQRGLSTIGIQHSESRISSDSQTYWSSQRNENWKDNSHWRDAPAFADNDLWQHIGRDHLTLFEGGARLTEFDRPWNRVLEWGCGGGANAIWFAPRASEFIGVDISPDSLRECHKQISAVCATQFTPVLVDVADPEAALAQTGGNVDIVLSFYVFELLPSPEYGARILRIAHDLLAPGGLALIQMKYDTGKWTTRPRRRTYKTGLANMTTYPLADFWELAAASGFTPEAIRLIPKNELDERYAYFFLSKPTTG